jgi:hypothetical protein
VLPENPQALAVVSVNNNLDNFENTTKDTNNMSLIEKIENIAEHLYDFYSIVYSQVQMMKMVNYI